MTAPNDAPPTRTACPDEPTSRLFGEGQLPEEQARLVSRHVAGCASCQARPDVSGAFAPTLPPDPTPPALGLGLGEAKTVAAASAPEPIGEPGARAGGRDRGSGVLPRGSVVGRYVVLEPIGAGGMGVVYSAYDPEPDRRVAVKLLRESAFAHGSASEGQTRLLREAQALAQLSHPHVVAIYDAGRASGSVFLAMEYVDGATLREWLRAADRPLAAKLEVFRQAGSGLAAAHSAGLIHRDFKPDNVLIDRKARAKVLDFGLARAASDLGTPSAHRGDLLAGASGVPSGDLRSAPITRTGALMGTPHYMALEQLRCEPATEKSDQFSFCVALFEALYGAMPFAGGSLTELAAAVERGPLLPPDAPVPGWLERVVRRGLRPSPDQRFASMDALLVELGRDPAAQRRHRRSAALAALALLAVAAAAILYGRRKPAEAPLLCGAADRRLDGIWDGRRRAQIEAAFLATGKPFAAAAFQSVAEELDRYSAAWVAMDVQACEASRARGHETETIHELRSTCLEHHVQELRALTDTFVSADRGVVTRAPAAARSLSPVARCGDIEQLSAAPPPPVDAGVRQRVSHVRSKLTDARALLSAGRHAEARKITDEALVQARQIDYAPVLAEGLLARGRVLRAESELAGAEDAFEGAVQAALAGRDDESMVRAMTELVSLVGVVLERPAEGRRWARLADGVMQRVKNRALEADLDEAAGRLLGDQARHDEARARLTRSLTLRQQLGLKGTKLADVRHRLGVIARSRGRLDEALAYEEQALADLEAAFGPDHPLVAAALVNVGALARQDRRYPKAEERLDRAVQILDRLPPGPELVPALAELGSLSLDQQRPASALPTLERARAVVAAHPGEPGSSAAIDAALGRARWEVGQDRPASRKLVQAARAALATAGAGFQRPLAETDAWLDAHPQ